MKPLRAFHLLKQLQVLLKAELQAKVISLFNFQRLIQWLCFAYLTPLSKFKGYHRSRSHLNLKKQCDRGEQSGVEFLQSNGNLEPSLSLLS